MQMQTRRIIVVLFIGAILAVQPSFPAMAQPVVDHAIFGDLLKSYVDNGQVDYTGYHHQEKTTNGLHTAMGHEKRPCPVRVCFHVQKKQL